jgi:hypothetical protein
MAITNIPIIKLIIGENTSDRNVPEKKIPIPIPIINSG